ncbi:MAG TPA: tetratricopeptide repeat protein [Bryobacteraceae bacterium]|nr:tetratricopeptide repeat protein [Bryobacteraceae bacterium]
MLVPLLVAGLFAAPTGTLEAARNRQDRPALEKLANDACGAAGQKANDFDAQMRCALTASYLAEVDQEQRDKKAAQQAALRGVQAANKAVALKPQSGEAYRLLGMLYGQTVTDLVSGLSNGPRAKEAINKAVALAPKSSGVYVARGVGNYYLPAQLGGGAEAAIADFRKAIELDGKNAEAYLWLGLALRKENKDGEARQAFAKALALEPDRVWAKQQLDKTPAK